MIDIKNLGNLPIIRKFARAIGLDVVVDYGIEEVRAIIDGEPAIIIDYDYPYCTYANTRIRVRNVHDLSIEVIEIVPKNLHHCVAVCEERVDGATNGSVCLRRRNSPRTVDDEEYMIAHARTVVDKAKKLDNTMAYDQDSIDKEYFFLTMNHGKAEEFRQMMTDDLVFRVN